MFGKKLKDSRVLKLLSSTLNQEKTIQKVSPISPNGEEKMYNFYSMLILSDAIVKYQIIVKEDSYFSYFLNELTRLISNYESHQELVIGIHTILLEIVRKQLNLPNLVDYSNRRQVLLRIYDRYIVNGYCYHSFPSYFQEEVEFNGIDPKNYQYPIDKIKKIAYIFENHHYKDFIKKIWEEKNQPLYITDSFAMANYYAYTSPDYFAQMTSIGPYMKDKEYDRFAFFRKDYEACKRNLHHLGEHVHLSLKEKEAVEDAFKEQWNALKLDQAIPCIAFIERKAIGRNKLENLKQILEEDQHEDLLVSMAKILDSKYPNDARFSPILSLDFTVETVPTYQEIEQQHEKKIEQEKPVLPICEEDAFVVEIESEEDLQEENPIFFPQPVNNHGYADVIALCGFLSIISGLTLILILNYFGIR